MSRYAEQLKDPRWQRKRLEVLQRNCFSCFECGAKDKTLHVHHGYYERGLAPWEYPDNSLHCLCEDCHERAQGALTKLHRVVGHLTGDDVDRLQGYAQALISQYHPSVEVVIHSYAVACGVGSFYHIDDTQLWALGGDEPFVITADQLTALRDRWPCNCEDCVMRRKAIAEYQRATA